MPGITSALVRAARRSVHFPRHQTEKRQFLLRKDRGKLLAAIAKDQKVKAVKASRPPVAAPSIIAAFYAPWQETGLHSLRANASHMTHLMPAWVHLADDGKTLDYHDWDPDTNPHTNDVLQVAHTNNLNIVPVFQNAQMNQEGSGEFDPKRVHYLLTNVPDQNHLILTLRSWLLANRFQGLNVDFEQMDPADYPLFIDFLRRMKAQFAPARLTLSVDLEAQKPLDWNTISSVCDFVIVMAYDEHSSVGKPGPIASIRWYRDVVLKRALEAIPREKLVVGLANYAYDWQEGREWADPLTFQGALLTAQKFRVVPNKEKPEDVIDFDTEALNPTFWYTDDAGKDHEVWFLDGVTVANQWNLAQMEGVRGMAVWVLGSTDPSVWTFIRRDRPNERPNFGVLRSLQFPYDVEFTGDGEIAHVDANPTKGDRSIEVDPDSGIATDEDYHHFPTSYVIARSGFHKGEIALTIDDGPAAGYSTQILDELKALNVKATFFLIGQNAERYPYIVRRMWREGHEIGNHSYTHTNIGAVSEERARLELNATQRVFQAILHRSTLLFRPPYNADAEPTSAEEVTPIQVASSLNYITVLEFIDPQDWNPVERDPKTNEVRPRTAQDMLASVEAQLNTEHGSCILLHDGGGDRTQTVRLIPILVHELQKKGYKFVTVSGLIGATRDQVNPPVKETDTLLLANDRVVFESLFLIEFFLGTAFVSAIVLGTARVVFITVLALIGQYRKRYDKFDESIRPPVSVVIAAFNEAKVIVRTIEAVLATDYGPLEVIIVDDGSKDDTSAVVMSHFGEHPSVHVFHEENAGKAAALNRGIASATGEIIIALDADTIFTKSTIMNLVRHFADPLVGAVAGNVKVGNRINPLTYWQAIEYVTSQNLDRRAYSVINSVSVVPGAVGAWRREAVLQAGGYTTDTMAEDMDLTWRIRRIGWRVETDTDAIGFTEAPDSFRSLFKQRFRWAFGTLQSLWKHRRALGRYGWFGRVMLPSLWLFQVLYQELSPLVDMQILWTLGNVVNAFVRGELKHDWKPLPQALTALYLVGFMYAFFFVIELIGSIVAFKLDREDPRMLVWLFWQRFLYRQLMYAVLLKSIKTAVSGIRTGWGKLERKGTVELVSS